MSTARLGSFFYRLAGPEDDGELRDILRQTPLPGSVTVTMEREPSFFHGATVEGDVHQSVTCVDEERQQLVGLGTRSIHDAYLNGEPARLGYLSQLRMRPEYQGRARLLQKGFRFGGELHDDGATQLYVTTLIDGNRRAQRILEKSWKGKPTYVRRGQLFTYALPLLRKRRASADVPVRAARQEDLEQIASCLQRNNARYQLAPRWTVESLRDAERTRGLQTTDFFVAADGDRVLGCLARWDQSAYKQTIIRGYSGALKWLRPLTNAAAVVGLAPRLPAVGDGLRSYFISHMAVDEDRADVFEALLTAAYNAGVGSAAAFAMIGLCDSHPLLPVVRQYRHIEYRSLLYVVHWPDGEAAAAALDDRPNHVEIATL